MDDAVNDDDGDGDEYCINAWTNVRVAIQG